MDEKTVNRMNPSANVPTLVEPNTEEHGPTLPPRHAEAGSEQLPPPPSYDAVVPNADATYYQPDQKHSQLNPALPPRPGYTSAASSSSFVDPYGPPPVRKSADYGEDLSSPIHYVRDPHKLIAYLVPFPPPRNAPAEGFPQRFMIYTPPPPPIPPAKEGVKEDRMTRVQRKWQTEVREAKQSDAKVTSWKGVKSRATKGINAAMGWVTTSNLDFLTRVPGEDAPKGKENQASQQVTTDHHGDDDLYSDPTTKKTVGLEEMVLIYPSTMPGSEQQIREEFVGTMMRSKSKAQRDAVIGTGLLPVSLAVDLLATLVWPFGGLLEVDAVWTYSSFRGAKTARSVTKRLHSSSPSDDAKTHDTHNIRLTFTPSQRLDVLRRYLAGECHRRDAYLFPSSGSMPTETEVIEAIGWSPSQTAGETRNWEDEQWEISEVKDDIRGTMSKGAKEWLKWCKAYEKNPQKAVKK